MNTASTTIQNGDRITFKAVTRWSDRAVTRKVNGFSGDKPTVRYGGWAEFVVRLPEITKVEKAA